MYKTSEGAKIAVIPAPPLAITAVITVPAGAQERVPVVVDAQAAVVVQVTVTAVKVASGVYHATVVTAVEGVVAAEDAAVTAKMLAQGAPRAAPTVTIAVTSIVQVDAKILAQVVAPTHQG